MNLVGLLSVADDLATSLSALKIRVQPYDPKTSLVSPAKARENTEKEVDRLLGTAVYLQRHAHAAMLGRCVLGADGDRGRTGTSRTPATGRAKPPPRRRWYNFRRLHGESHAPGVPRWAHGIAAPLEHQLQRFWPQTPTRLGDRAGGGNRPFLPPCPQKTHAADEETDNFLVRLAEEQAQGTAGFIDRASPPTPARP